ncbi:MAG: M48 family metalloprotease [Candidatus Hodarchaeota archaeon]
MAEKIQVKNLSIYIILITYFLITLILPIICTAFEAAFLIFVYHGSLFSTGILWYWLGAKSILKKNNIRFLKSNEYPLLQNYISKTIEDLKLRIKVKVAVLDEALPNAFTLFLSPKKYLIVFSIGLFENLEFNEIKAVITHELFHIKNKDVWIKSLFIVGRFLWFPTGPILESYISRSRETQADLESSFLTKDPYSLATALIKMVKCYISKPDLTFKMSNISKSFWIVDNKYKKDKNFIKKILSRHPSTESRVKKLIKMNI